MSTPLEAVSQHTTLPRNSNSPLRKKTYKLMIISWLMLVGCGMGGAFLYTNYLKMALTADLAKQNQSQLQSIQADYQSQLAHLKTSLEKEMTGLQVKVDELNQLLAFTKDNASSNKDNSNQLYTQLAEVKKKLIELQKDLDVLK
jgi:septal ring factor EnvC (AmiA/AmiB activator)